jgi:hypothetical protein
MFTNSITLLYYQRSPDRQVRDNNLKNALDYVNRRDGYLTFLPINHFSFIQVGESVANVIQVVVVCESEC